jgi:hypothetical protein
LEVRNFENWHVCLNPSPILAIPSGIIYRASIAELPLPGAIGEIHTARNGEALAMQADGFHVEDEEGSHIRFPESD